MASGVKTGGRKKGTPNKFSLAKEIAASGETPLNYMLRIMCDEQMDVERRDDMAKAAAPYVHARLAAVQHTGKDGGPIQTEDVSARDALLGRIGLVSARVGTNGSAPKPH